MNVQVLFLFCLGLMRQQDMEAVRCVCVVVVVIVVAVVVVGVVRASEYSH